MTPADLTRVLDRYVATGEAAPALAAALGLDAADVAAVLPSGAAPVQANAPAAAPRPKRVRKAPTSEDTAPRRKGAPAEGGDVADPGRTLRGRDAVTVTRSYGHGYASVITGRRGI